jgi:hypothetical protein
MAEHREIFETDRGFRLFHGETSICINSLSMGKPLTPTQLFAYCAALNAYMAALGVGGASDGISSPDSRAMLRTDFSECDSGKLYKYVSTDTWTRYLSRGHVQLGSAAYYRKIENPLINDAREGYSFLSLISNQDQLLAHLDVGANFHLFCGTTRANTAKNTMRERFGEALIEIVDVEAFAGAIQSKIGATAYRVHDVVYSNVKAISVDYDYSDVADRLRIDCRSTLTSDALHIINQRLHDAFREYGLLASLFSKPIHPYAVERERRIAFEMPADTTTSVLQFDCPEIISLLRLKQR